MFTSFGGQAPMTAAGQEEYNLGVYEGFTDGAKGLRDLLLLLAAPKAETDTLSALAKINFVGFGSGAAAGLFSPSTIDQNPAFQQGIQELQKAYGAIRN